MSKNSDKTWEQYGRENPYYGVLTDPKYQGKNLNNETSDEFFATGELHATSIFDTIHNVIDPTFQPRSALDFGCGVGRLAIPLAKRCPRVIGVDVSPSMLTQARRNRSMFGVNNLELITPDELSDIDDETIDLIHSYIVFQHIPPRRGMRLLDELLKRLAPGAVGVLHFTFASRKTLWQRLVYQLRLNVPGLHGTINLLKRRPFRSYPVMQMNQYSIDRILDHLEASGVSNLHVEFTNHGSTLGAVFYFRTAE